MPDTAPAVDFVVAAFDKSMFPASLKVATLLRQAGQQVHSLPLSRIVLPDPSASGCELTTVPAHAPA